MTSAILTPLCVLTHRHTGVPEAPYVGVAHPHRSFVTVADGSSLLLRLAYVTGYKVAPEAFVAARLASGVLVVPAAHAVRGLGVGFKAALCTPLTPQQTRSERLMGRAAFPASGTEDGRRPGVREELLYRSRAVSIMTPSQHMLWKKEVVVVVVVVVPLRGGEGHPPPKSARRGDWRTRHHSLMGLVGMDVVREDIIAAVDGERGKALGATLLVGLDS